MKLKKTKQKNFGQWSHNDYILTIFSCNTWYAEQNHKHNTINNTIFNSDGMKKFIQMNFQMELQHYLCLKIAYYCNLELNAHQFKKNTTLNPILLSVLGTEALPFHIRNRCYREIRAISCKWGTLFCSEMQSCARTTSPSDGWSEELIPFCGVTACLALICSSLLANTCTELGNHGFSGYIKL